MHQHNHGPSGRSSPLSQVRRLLLVGNPNVGKSVIFHYLSGKYATVSNYPGTTVEVTRGHANLGNEAWEIIDTPGIQSLLPGSEDERVTRDILLDGEGEPVIVQVSDAKNLRRSLLVASQLAELGFPMVVSLNMFDEAARRGIKLDTRTLSETLGVEVLETIAVDGKGLSDVKEACARAKRSSFLISFDPAIEDGVRRISQHLPIHERRPAGHCLAAAIRR